MRVAVFGASGFVGATLVQRLWQSDAIEVRPIIHSSGNAARLSRFGRPLVTADAMHPETLDAALDGCTHVVNCSRGPAEMMLTGLRNMLDASRRAQVRRFVHLSSVAAYGDLEGRRVLSGTERPEPLPKTYGWTKQQQDELVMRAHRDGLSCAILCPPNISGIYSPFLMDIVTSLRRREFALVADGALPCELVDVENLVHAITLALEAPEPGGERIFITDSVDTSWSDVALALAPLADHPLPLPSMSMEEAVALTKPQTRTPSVTGAAKHMVSGEVRSALRKDPWIASAERSVKGWIKQVPSLNRTLRRRLEEKPSRRRTHRPPAVSQRLVAQQLRNVRYSQEAAQRTLGYRPVVSVAESQAAFRRWYSGLIGWGNDSWLLTRHLYE
jgi:nucleoside-diphosphate-sugar epimerase